MSKIRNGEKETRRKIEGAVVQEENNEAFEDTMAHLTEKLTEQMAEAQRLDAAISENLEMVGIGENS